MYSALALIWSSLDPGRRSRSTTLFSATLTILAVVYFFLWTDGGIGESGGGVKLDMFTLIR